MLRSLLTTANGTSGAVSTGTRSATAKRSAKPSRGVVKAQKMTPVNGCHSDEADEGDDLEKGGLSDSNSLCSNSNSSINSSSHKLNAPVSPLSRMAEEDASADDDANEEDEDEDDDEDNDVVDEDNNEEDSHAGDNASGDCAIDSGGDDEEPMIVETVAVVDGNDVDGEVDDAELKDVEEEELDDDEEELIEDEEVGAEEVADVEHTDELDQADEAEERLPTEDEDVDGLHPIEQVCRKDSSKRRQIKKKSECDMKTSSNSGHIKDTIYCQKSRDEDDDLHPTLDKQPLDQEDDIEEMIEEEVASPESGVGIALTQDDCDLDQAVSTVQIFSEEAPSNRGLGSIRSSMTVSRAHGRSGAGARSRRQPAKSSAISAAVAAAAANALVTPASAAAAGSLQSSGHRAVSQFSTTNDASAVKSRRGSALAVVSPPSSGATTAAPDGVLCPTSEEPPSPTTSAVAESNCAGTPAIAGAAPSANTAAAAAAGVAGVTVPAGGAGPSGTSAGSANRKDRSVSTGHGTGKGGNSAGSGSGGEAATSHTPGSNVKLIKLVRKEPCLWDPRNVQYRDSAKKDRCWEDIARQVNMQIGHARQRWKSLRDTFTRKVRKISIIEHAGGSYGGSGEDPCQWKYFQQLRFLERVIHTQRPRLQPGNGTSCNSSTTHPVKNALALASLTLPINPLDCDEDEEEDIGTQRSWPLQDERELIHYMRCYPLLWNEADANFNNDASRDMAIIQIHTNFQERYTWSEIQNKIGWLVRKFKKGDHTWIHHEALQYIASATSGAPPKVKKLKLESADSDECSAEECANSFVPQIEMEEEADEVKPVTASTAHHANNPTAKVTSTSLGGPTPCSSTSSSKSGSAPASVPVNCNGAGVTLPSTNGTTNNVVASSSAAAGLIQAATAVAAAAAVSVNTSGGCGSGQLAVGASAPSPAPAASPAASGNQNGGPSFTLQSLPAALQNAAALVSGAEIAAQNGASSPIKIITVAPNGTATQGTFALAGGPGANGSSTILIPSISGQGILQMLQAAKACGLTGGNGAGPSMTAAGTGSHDATSLPTSAGAAVATGVPGVTIASTSSIVNALANAAAAVANTNNSNNTVNSSGVNSMLAAGSCTLASRIAGRDGVWTAASIERRIETFTSWVRAYLVMVEPDELDRIELDIHELMVRHTKQRTQRWANSSGAPAVAAGVTTVPVSASLYVNSANAQPIYGNGVVCAPTAVAGVAGPHVTAPTATTVATTSTTGSGRPRARGNRSKKAQAAVAAAAAAQVNALAALAHSAASGSSAAVGSGGPSQHSVTDAPELNGVTIANRSFKELKRVSALRLLEQHIGLADGSES